MDDEGETYSDPTSEEGFESPLEEARKEKKPEGRHHGRKSDFGRKGHRRKKRSSTRK